MCYDLRIRHYIKKHFLLTLYNDSKLGYRLESTMEFWKIEKTKHNAQASPQKNKN